MRIILASLLALALGAAPAAAQDADRAARVDLARQYLALTDGSVVRRVTEEQLKIAFSAENVGVAERTWLVGAIGELTQRTYGEAMADIRDEVADLFTREELEAMVAFGSTPVGRSIAVKGGELGLLVNQAFGSRMVAAMPSLYEKYCLRFDCPAEGEEPTSAK